MSTPARLVRGLGLLLSAAAVAAVGAGRVWPFELLTHFAVQHLLALVAAASAGAWIGGRARRRAAVPAAAALLLGGVMATRLDPAPGDVADGARAEATALFMNVLSSNRDHGRAIARIREVDADVVGLAEVDARWAAALEALADAYPHRHVVPREGNFGVALLSRTPMEASTERFVEDGPASIVARLRRPDGPWTVVVTHPPPPVTPGRLRARSRHLEALGRRVRDLPGAVVVLGDFNLSRWSPWYGDWLRASGARSAMRGPGQLYTWPAGFPPLALGIDHCFVAGSAAARSADVLPGIGSDHRPVRCTVAIGGG